MTSTESTVLLSLNNSSSGTTGVFDMEANKSSILTITVSVDNEDDANTIRSVKEGVCGKRKAEIVCDAEGKRKCIITVCPEDEEEDEEEEEAKRQLALMYEGFPKCFIHIEEVDFAGVLRSISKCPSLLNEGGRDRCYLYMLYYHTTDPKWRELGMSTAVQRTLFFEMVDGLLVTAPVHTCEYIAALVELSRDLREGVKILEIMPFLNRIFHRTPIGTEGRKAVVDAILKYFCIAEYVEFSRAFSTFDIDFPTADAVQRFMTDVSDRDLSSKNARQLADWVKCVEEENDDSCCDLRVESFFCDTAETSWPAFWRHMCELADTA